MPAEDQWHLPPSLADSPTIVGSGQAVLACLVLGCVLVLGGFSIGGLADPVRSVDTYVRIDAVQVGAREPKIHFSTVGRRCGREAAVLTCTLDIGGRSVEVRADSSARTARCAVLADGRPVPCMIGAGPNRSTGAVVSIVDDLGLPGPDYRRLASKHRQVATGLGERVVLVGAASAALGVASAFLAFRTLPVSRLTENARRVAAVGTGLSFAAGLVCWWFGRLVAAGFLL